MMLMVLEVDTAGRPIKRREGTICKLTNYSCFSHFFFTYQYYFKNYQFNGLFINVTRFVGRVTYSFGFL